METERPGGEAADGEQPSAGRGSTGGEAREREEEGAASGKPPGKRRRRRRRRSREDEAPRQGVPANPEAARQGVPANPEAARQPPPREMTLEARALHALNAMRALSQALGERQGLSPPLPIDRLVIPVSIRPGTLDPNDPMLREDAARLVAELGGRLEESLRARTAFREGRVYCFWCASPDCPHTAPEQPTDTFVGYLVTGRPEWQSFPNLCIERGETRVELLYGDPPEIIALVQQARELKGRLMPGFGQGSMVYNLLGQVVAGLVPAHLDPGRPAVNRVALTFQFLETRSGIDRRRLRLNVIGLSPDEIAERAATAPPRSPAERLRRALGSTRDRLEAIGRKLAHAESRGEPFDAEQAVRPLLYALKNELERTFRRSPQRTLHAQARHVSVERPTSSALQDARRASYDALFFDAEYGTVVVIGPKGRAHIFSPEGRHVTSIQLQTGELERKTGRARWKPLEHARADAFRERLAQPVARREEQAGALQVEGLVAWAKGSQTSR